MNEKNIVEQIIAGDSELYRELVERYQAGLIIHCENILKDRSEGEDVAQEAFIKAFQSIAKFSAEKGQFSTWLYRIATNLCIDQLRKNKRKVNVKDIETYMEQVVPTHIADDEKSQIQKAINELEPPKYGDIIKEYFWAGKSYQELADTYHTSTNTIGTWMSRAKVQLKEKLS